MDRAVRDQGDTHEPMRGLEGLGLDQARQGLGVFTSRVQNSGRNQCARAHSSLSRFEHSLGAVELGLASAPHAQFDQEVPHVRNAR